MSVREEWERIEIERGKELTRLREENREMRATLKFYADRRNWQNMELNDVGDDYEQLDPTRPLITGGRRAREALARFPEGKE